MVIYWAGIFIVPIWFFWGYVYEIMRRVIVDREQPSLPEWDDWDTLLKNGLRVFGVRLVFSSPYIIFFFFPMIILFFQAFLGENISLLEDYFFSVFSNPFMMAFMVIVLIVYFFGSFFTTIAVAHMIAKDDIAAAFRVKEWWPIFRHNVSGYVISFILVVGVYWIASLVSQIFIFTIVLCCVYPFVITLAAIFMYVMGGVIFAQAYCEGVDKLQAKSSAT